MLYQVRTWYYPDLCVSIISPSRSTAEANDHLFLSALLLSGAVSETLSTWQSSEITATCYCCCWHYRCCYRRCCYCSLSSYRCCCHKLYWFDYCCFCYYSFYYHHYFTTLTTVIPAILRVQPLYYQRDRSITRSLQISV